MGFEQIISQEPQIATELADGILTITLNRPERLNAWTGQMGGELMAVFDRSDADDEVRRDI
jgi:enoyl-CoA hydratase/carnithine racemase